MSTDAEILRSFIAPISVRAVRAGADALDAVTRLEATIAGLEATVELLTDRIRDLTTNPRGDITMTDGPRG